MMFLRVIAATGLLLALVFPLHDQVFAEHEALDNLQFPPLDFTIHYPEKFKLNNGIQVYFKQDSELPLLDVSVVVSAGKIGVPNALSGLSQVLAQLLRSGGAGEWSAEQLDQRLEELAANVKVSSETYTTTFTLSLLSDDAATGLELLQAMVREPRFDEQRFTVAQQQLLESIRRRGDNSAHLARLLMMRTLYAGHPLAFYPTQRSVNRLTVDHLRHYYRQFFGPQNTRIVISGALSANQARTLLEHSFGDWAAEVKPSVVPPLKPLERSGTLLVDRPVPQTSVLLTQLGIEKSNPDLYALQVMNYILGGGGFSSRLMREVRSNRGLAYSVYSYFSVGRRLRGPFIAGCETKNASVAQVVELMRHEMRLMRDRQISPTELQQAKDSLINSFVFAFDDTHALSKRIMAQEMYGYPEHYLDEYRQHIQEVTVEDVQRVARRYLNLDRQVLILIGDKQQLQPALKELGGEITEVDLDSLL